MLLKELRSLETTANTLLAIIALTLQTIHCQRLGNVCRL